MTMKHFMLMGFLATVSFLPFLPAFAAAEDALAVPGKVLPVGPAVLTLDQAVTWALEKSPVLAASRSRADAATASRSQAGALPNPELSIEAENIYGDAPYEDMESAEITYGVEQLVELPGKRGNRVRMAESEKVRIHFERDGAQLDLIRDVTVAFAALVAAEQDLYILEKEATLAAEVRDSVAAKVTAGKEPPIQRNKADIELSTSQIALDRAHRMVTTKKQSLAALLGGTLGDFAARVDSLPVPAEPEPLEIYRARLTQTPDIQILEADVSQAKAALSLEKANAIPDPTLSFGMKEFREDDTSAFVAGLSLPIPIFNMNRAGIRRAGHELNAVKMDQIGSQLSWEATLAEVYGDFISAYREASTLKTSVLPGAEEAFDFARGGYEAGKFGYLEVLDAQRTLFDARRQYNQSILEYHTQRAVIERMTARHAHENTSDKE